MNDAQRGCNTLRAERPRHGQDATMPRVTKKKKFCHQPRLSQQQKRKEKTQNISLSKTTGPLEVCN